MPDDDRFRRYVVRDEERPGELELLLVGIEFMREELDEASGSLPASRPSTCRKWRAAWNRSPGAARTRPGGPGLRTNLSRSGCCTFGSYCSPPS